MQQDELPGKGDLKLNKKTWIRSPAAKEERQSFELQADVGPFVRAFNRTRRLIKMLKGVPRCIKPFLRAFAHQACVKARGGRCFISTALSHDGAPRQRKVGLKRRAISGALACDALCKTWLFACQAC